MSLETGPKWIWLLCGGVIVVAIASAIVVLFLFPTPSVVQYRLTISLLCFALSSVAGLLFAANVEIKGSVGKLSLTLAGPAALWVATLIVFKAIFPETALVPGKAYDLRLNLIFPEAIWPTRSTPASTRSSTSAARPPNRSRSRRWCAGSAASWCTWTRSPRATRSTWSWRTRGGAGGATRSSPPTPICR